MSFLQFLLIILTVLALSAGQVLFKLTAADLQLSLDHFLASFLNMKLFIALLIYAIATVLWLIALKLTPLKVAYPFMGLAFIFVPIFSRIFLGEAMHWQNFAGAVLILCGIWIASSY